MADDMLQLSDVTWALLNESDADSLSPWREPVRRGPQDTHDWPSIEAFVAEYERKHGERNTAPALAEWLLKLWRVSSDQQQREWAEAIDDACASYTSAYDGRSRHEVLKYAFDCEPAACWRWKSLKDLISKRRSARRLLVYQAAALLNAFDDEGLQLSGWSESD